MPIPSRRGALGPLPPYTWDEQDYEWSGRQPTHETTPALDGLPIAYLRSQLEADGHAIYYESPKGVAANNRLRVPCVILGGSEGLISGLPPEWKVRFDNLGVIHASLPVSPEIGDSPYQPPQLQGLPVLARDDDSGGYDLKDPSKYVGYRVYVWLGAVGFPQEFLDFDFDPYNSTTLPFAVCPEGTLSSLGDACDDAECEGVPTFEYEHEPTDGETVEVRSFEETLEIFESHMDSFNGYRVVAWYNDNVSDIYVQEMCGCGITGAEICDPTPVVDEGSEQPVMIFIGTDEALQTKAAANFEAVWSQLPEVNRFLPGADPDTYDVLTDMLLFFEKVPL